MASPPLSNVFQGNIEYRILTAIAFKTRSKYDKSVLLERNYTESRNGNLKLVKILSRP